MNGPINRLGNCLDLLLSDAPCVVDLHLETSISFTINLFFFILSITFSRQLYLISHFYWSRVRQDLQESTWGNVYNIPDSVNAL